MLNACFFYLIADARFPVAVVIIIYPITIQFTLSKEKFHRVKFNNCPLMFLKLIAMSSGLAPNFIKIERVA
jgi:1-acyl-sn-glycerol-3-phosphate acyltransferase